MGERRQRFCRGAERAAAVLAIDDAHRGLGQVDRIVEQGHRSLAVGDGAVESLDGRGGILPEIIDQPLEKQRLRLDRQHPRARPGAQGDEQAARPAARSDIEEGHVRLDAVGDKAPLLAVGELRREQQPLFAGVVVRIKPHPRLQRLHRDVDGPRPQAAQAETAHQQGRTLAEPVRSRVPREMQQTQQGAVRLVTPERRQIVGRDRAHGAVHISRRAQGQALHSRTHDHAGRTFLTSTPSFMIRARLVSGVATRSILSSGLPSNTRRSA